MIPSPLFALLLVLSLLAACASEPMPEPELYARPAPVDMAGAWELDHARSDNIQEQLRVIARQLQREAERRARAAERGQAVSGGALPSGRDVFALAEMAELITAPTLLDVVQTDTQIRLKRDNSFALICNTDVPPPSVSVTPFGSEQCGWDGHQLFFDIALPDDLLIRHRITRPSLTDVLVIRTAVYSPTVRDPFVVRKVFTRYQPERAGYRCTQTLSRGKVCTTEAPEPR